MPYPEFMRTTVSLQPDVAAAVARLQRERGFGISEALNELVRRGLSGRSSKPASAGRTKPALRTDVTNVADALDLMAGPDRH